MRNAQTHTAARSAGPFTGPWRQRWWMPAAIAVLLGAPVITEAQTVITWGSATNGNWTDTTKWTGGVAPANSLTTNIANFNSTGVTVTIDANRSVAGIQFGSTAGAYTITKTGGGTTLTLGASGIVSNSSNTQTVGGGSLTLAMGAASTFSSNGSGSLNIASALNRSGFALTLSGTGNGTVSGVISGTGAVTKTGTGTWTLSGANTYSGATNIGTLNGATGGTLALGASNVLPGTAVTIYGGTLAMGANSDTIGTLSLGGGASGTTAAVTGTGTLTLGGNVTYNAANNPNGASISANLALGTANRTFTIGDSSAATNDLTVSGNVSGAYAIIKQGAGTLALSGANNTFTGGVTLSAGTLALNSARAPGTGRLTINAGTTLDNTSGATVTLVNNNQQTWNGNFTFAGTNSLNLGTGTVTMAANTTINTAANTLTVGGTINGSFGLTKIGDGTLALTNSNNYSGATRIYDGTLAISNITSLGGSGTAAANLLIDGGTLQYVGTGASSTGRSLTIGIGGATIDASGAAGATLAFTSSGTAMAYSGSGNRTLTLTGSNTGNNEFDLLIADSGGATTLVKSGTGTWVLNNNSNTNWNSFTGNTYVNTGTLLLSSKAGKNAAGTGDLIIGDGSGTAALVRYQDANNQLGNQQDIYLNSNGTFNTNGFTDTMGMIADGSATSGGFGSFVVGSSTLTVGTSNRSGTFSGTMSGSGSVTWNGTGTWTLAGNNSGFTGNLSLNAGGIGIKSSTALGSGTFTIGAGATISNATSAPLTISGLTGQTWNSFTFTGSNDLNMGTSVVTLGSDLTITTAGSATLTAAGVITGGNSLDLVKAGAGTLLFTANNTYSGTTTVSDGVLQIGAGGTSGSLGSGSVTNNATLIFNRSDATTVSNTVSGNGTINFNGSGTTTLSGANSAFTGTINVNAGTLKVQSNNSALGASTGGGTNVASGATLQINGGLTTVNNGTLQLAGTGDGGIGALLGTGGNNRYSGNITLAGNTTVVNNSTGYLALGMTSTLYNRAINDPSGVPVDASTIALNGNTLTIKGTTSAADNRAVYVNGRITDGSGAASNVIIDMTRAADIVRYTANMNTYTGTTTIKMGTLSLATLGNTYPNDPTHPNWFAINGPIVVGTGTGATDSAILQIDATSGVGGRALNEQINFNATLTLNKDGRFNLAALQSLGGITFNGGAISLGTTGGLFLNGDVTVNTSTSTATISGTGGSYMSLSLNPGTGLSANSTRTFNVVGGSGLTSDLTIATTINHGSIVKNGAGIMTITSDNTLGYGGTTTINNGILNIQNNNALGQGDLTSNTATIVNSGGTLQLSNVANGDLTVANEALQIAGTGYGGNGALQNVAGNNTWRGGITLNSTNATIQADAGTLLTISNGAINSSSGGSLTVTGAGNTTIAAVIGSGVTGLTKNGTGTLTLTGFNASTQNTYSGQTVINQGVVSMQNNYALGSTSAGTVVAGTGAALELSNAALGGGNLDTAAEALTLNGTGISGAGALRNVAGNNAYNGLVTIASSSLITANSGTTLTLAAGTTSANQNLTIGTTANNGDVRITGAISNGTGELTKQGSGNLTFASTSGSGALSGTVGKTHLLNGTLTVGDGVAGRSTTLNTLALDASAGTTLMIAAGSAVRANYQDGVTFFSGTMAATAAANGQSAATFQKSGSGTLVFNNSFTASNLTLELSGGTVAFGYNPDGSKVATQITVGTIHITGDTILDFGNSAGTFLSSTNLIIDAGVNVTVVNWITSANVAGNSTIWYLRSGAGTGGTLQNSLTLTPGGTDLKNTSPLPQITFVDPQGSTGSTTTWVNGGHDGWFDHEIRPTPEPGTYGALLMSGCLAVLGIRSYRQRKAAAKA